MLLLAILFVTIIGALALVNYVDQRHARVRAIRARLTRLRYEVEDLEETLECLENILPERQVAWHVNQEILRLLNTMLNQEPGNTSPIQTSIEKAEERAQRLADGRRKPRVGYARNSDAKIAQAQHYLNKAATVIRRRQSRDELDLEQQETFLRELTWASLMVSVASFVNQGNKAVRRNDSMSAHAFFKKAQGMLIGSPHPNPERMRLIRELGELMSGRRTTISEDLLPQDDPQPSSSATGVEAEPEDPALAESP
ncbi:hypothetical protein [Marinimicrobium alkaliphilum]|uniref:hypothetical protein n=1 Tax=Marinimicrobium alkaliphilum TaxID=2202654 RepID=UPI000DB9AB13|nr:hypothetical protein [Marinimicrobium alkaliphilum]